jgi:hypothetical protein
MNKNLVKTAIRFGAVIVLVGWASWAVAGKPPQNTPHPCQVAVADRVGDSILSDGLGIYTDGVAGTGARLWDMVNGVADHLYFGAGSGRTLKLSIPSVTSGTQTCTAANLRPNLNTDQYQFYNVLPVGSSTADVGENFGGTFQCSFGSGNGTGSYNVTYESQCIVITHGQHGNTGSNPLEWTINADAGCTAKVTKVQKGKPDVTWSGLDVPFQVTATELP